MITGKEIKIAVNKLLSEFNIDIYGMEIIEGYKTPCFFTESVLQIEETVNLNTFRRTYLITITYFQNELNEADALEKQEKIRQQLISEKTRGKMMLMIGKKLIPVSGYHINWTGENGKIPQYAFTISYLDHEDRQETEETMNELIIRLEE